jgi:phosphohistidine phosphatase
VSPQKSSSLYLVRHAIAAERGSDWPDDTKRPLTSKGISRMRDVVAGLDDLEVRIELVLTSPLLRAKQTADLLANGLKPVPAVEILNELGPGGAPAKVAEALGSVSARRSVALVGHEPGLGELAAWLVGAKTPFEFKKGGICRIDLPGPPMGGSGQLIWLATPRMLRSLA